MNDCSDKSSDALQVVTDALKTHVDAIRGDVGNTQKPLITSIGSDIDGTLSDIKVGPLIDKFLVDAHENGIPVYIVSSHTSPEGFPFEIMGLVEDDDFLDKLALGGKGPGMGFEDEMLIGWDLYEPTYFHPNDVQTEAFLTAWAQLEPEQKTQVLNDWLNLHDRHMELIAPPPAQAASVDAAP